MKRRTSEQIWIDRASKEGLRLRETLGADVRAKNLERFLGSGQEHPVVIIETQTLLEEEGFGRIEARGMSPEDGFVIRLRSDIGPEHPYRVAAVSYLLTRVIFGDRADAMMAESFVSALTGQDPDQVYQRLCDLTDRV